MIFTASYKYVRKTIFTLIFLTVTTLFILCVCVCVCVCVRERERERRGISYLSLIHSTPSRASTDNFTELLMIPAVR